MQNVEIRGKIYSKIHELTMELDGKLKNGTLVPVNECRELISGINVLAIELENEFIYRGEMLRELIDKVHEVYMKNKFSFNLHPSEN